MAMSPLMVGKWNGVVVDTFGTWVQRVDWQRCNWDNPRIPRVVLECVCDADLTRIVPTLWRQPLRGHVVPMLPWPWPILDRQLPVLRDVVVQPWPRIVVARVGVVPLPLLPLFGVACVRFLRCFYRSGCFLCAAGKEKPSAGAEGSAFSHW